jgi:outer membrane lipoprotein-sorting protein
LLNKKIFKKLSVVILILLIGIGYTWVFTEKIKETNVVYIDRKDYNYKNVTSIQYQEVKETTGQGDGRQVKSSTITYVFPDKLRIESVGNTKIVEIYNNSKYINYDETYNRIRVKECFPPENPYIAEIEKRMVKILNEGKYEFFGYEEKDNKRLEVVGIKSELDGRNYMHKLWITDINDVILPVKEQYLIDNLVVSKTTYTYLKVNEPIKPDVFETTSLPQVEIVKDGVMPKYVESFAEAQKYLNFNLLLPSSIPIGFIPSEIAVIPPIQKPTFYCIYFKDGNRIYLSEKKSEQSFSPNASIGDLPCQVNKDGEQVSIMWRQDEIHVILHGDEEIADAIEYIAEQIAGGELTYI